LSSFAFFVTFVFRVFHARCSSRFFGALDGGGVVVDRL
jgi:hypothetical protein